MALTTYAELQTAVKSWLHRADLDSIIPDFITLAEARIMRTVRAREMETSFSDTIASGTISLPTNYIELKYAYLDTSTSIVLKHMDARFLIEKYPYRGSSGSPRYIAQEGSTFIFGPSPDSNYTVSGVYYKDLGPLSSSAHALFTTNPDLYLFGTLCEAIPYIKDDPRTILWESKFEEIKNEINMLTQRQQFSGGGMNIRPA
jgi:hypothetical protein